MLLTLSAISLAKRINAKRDPLTILDLPRFGQDELGLHGLNIQTELLKGWPADRIDRLRDEADKAACPCLLLSETQAHPLADPDEEVARVAIDRLDRVLRVGSRLGCSAVAIAVAGNRRPDAQDAAADRIKAVISRAERLELSVLVAPAEGLTASPEDLTTLIRSVGGFRIGSFPDFQTAAGSEDPTAYLRSLTPYASVVCGSFLGFDAKGGHKGFDLDVCLEAISSVGFDGSLALEYRGDGDETEAIVAMKERVLTHIEAGQKK